MTNHNEPAQQELLFQGASLLTRQEGDQPIEVHLEIDVRHVEVGTTWKQSLVMNRTQACELRDLLEYFINKNPI